LNEPRSAPLSHSLPAAEPSNSAALSSISRPIPSLWDLDPRILPLATDLITRAHIDLGFDCKVIDVIRTPAEQAHNLAIGVSWTEKSLHLPQPDCGKSHAIDIAPRHLMALKNWAPEHPDWEKLGALGESLGFDWGGRWKQRDCPHFEWHVPKETTQS
jgi:peptidoglycan L-alanyl-D-glutamate endopeptidase CwlK